MRVSEYYKLNRKQPSLDFIDVDISTDTRLFIDPSALLYLNNGFGNNCVYLVQNFFQTVLSHIHAGNNQRAIELLRVCKEPNETHLGLSSGVSRGTALGDKSSVNVWNALTNSEAITTGLIQDLEDTILLIPGLSEDRISDITTNIIRSELIAYTQDICAVLNIQTVQIVSGPLWNPDDKKWYSKYTELPYPEEEKLILVPKSIVRSSMHFDVSSYYRYSILEYYMEEELNANTNLVHLLKNRKKRVYIKDLKAKYPGGKANILDYTKQNPSLLKSYKRERNSDIPGPMDNFEISESMEIEPPDFQKLLDEIRSIPSGRAGFKRYETAIENYFSSVFYPSLDFPKKQTRIHGGRKIVDITYSNIAEAGFFKWLAVNYSAPHIFIECKNYTNDPTNPELDQLSGRFSNNRGRFGLLICRKIEDKPQFARRCKDTANDDRGYIIGLDDDDLEMLADEVQSEDGRLNFSLLRARFEQLVF